MPTIFEMIYFLWWDISSLLSSNTYYHKMQIYAIDIKLLQPDLSGRIIDISFIFVRRWVVAKFTVIDSRHSITLQMMRHFGGELFDMQEMRRYCWLNGFHKFEDYFEIASPLITTMHQPPLSHASTFIPPTFTRHCRRARTSKYKRLWATEEAWEMPPRLYHFTGKYSFLIVVIYRGGITWLLLCFQVSHSRCWCARISFRLHLFHAFIYHLLRYTEMHQK